MESPRIRLVKRKLRPRVRPTQFSSAISVDKSANVDPYLGTHDCLLSVILRHLGAHDIRLVTGTGYRRSWAEYVLTAHRRERPQARLAFLRSLLTPGTSR